MDSNSRKLKRELTFEYAKLNGLQQSVDLTLDDASTKALATEVRKQAGVCLQLLDKYQLSMPGRMRSYSEGKCQHLREDLRQTEMLFRDASGEFERRILQTSYRQRKGGPERWVDLYGLEDTLDGWGSDVHGEPEGEGEEQDPPFTSHAALSHLYIEMQNSRDIDGLMELVDDDVTFKLAFDPLLRGKAAVRRQYERDWADHDSMVVDVLDVFESERSVAVEVHVDYGAPSNLRYNGIVVHRWNEDGCLTHHQLYVDEVVPAGAEPERSSLSPHHDMDDERTGAGQLL